jgi:hypothetical protein
MAAAVLPLRDVSWVLAIPVGAAVYAGALLGLRTVSKGEIGLLEPVLGQKVAGMLRRAV